MELYEKFVILRQNLLLLLEESSGPTQNFSWQEGRRLVNHRRGENRTNSGLYNNTSVKGGLIRRNLMVRRSQQNCRVPLPLGRHQPSSSRNLAQAAFCRDWS